MAEFESEHFGRAEVVEMREVAPAAPPPPLERTIPSALKAGYTRFRHQTYARAKESYERLAHGQSPQTLIIACSDSRADPSMIFDAAPGELFVIRNVAALVPPFQADSGLHGVSAALEFAVKVLGVRRIVVMGHGHCGGVKACLGHMSPKTSGFDFLPQWVALATPARKAVDAALPRGTDEERQQMGEFETVGVSLGNLMSFPFVREKVAAGQLALHGAWYSVHKGSLKWRDPETGQFKEVEETPMNPKFIRLADNYYVSPQITAEEVAGAAEAGFDLIVNNRPDHEEPGQPLTADLAAAAGAAGIDWLEIPIGRDGISQDDITALQGAVGEHKKILGFCRTGTRSTVLRAMMQARNGMAPDDIIAEAAEGGYDIAAQRAAFEKLNGQA